MCVGFFVWIVMMRGVLALRTSEESLPGFLQRDPHGFSLTCLGGLQKPEHRISEVLWIFSFVQTAASRSGPARGWDRLCAVHGIRSDICMSIGWTP